MRPTCSFSTVFGDAGKMGKVMGSAPSLMSPKMVGGFKADINAMLQVSPGGISAPCSVLKKVVR